MYQICILILKPICPGFYKWNLVAHNATQSRQYQKNGALLLESCENLSSQRVNLVFKNNIMRKTNEILSSLEMRGGGNPKHFASFYGI